MPYLDEDRAINGEQTLEECLRFGAAAAALYIARPRDRFPARGEVEQRIRRHAAQEAP